MIDLVGIAAWNFREGTLAQRIETFAQMGFNAVSLIAGDACALCDGRMPDVEKVIEKHSLAVAIHAGFMVGDKHIPDYVLLSDFELYMLWNERSGALHAVNYDAALITNETGEHVYDAESMSKTLAKMLSMSNEAGFSVGVEDWPRNLEQMEAVSHLTAYPHFGILIDLGHMNMRIREDQHVDEEFPVKAAQHYLDNITLPVNELHVHNNNGVKDQHAPLDHGNADMAAIAEMLRRKGTTCISTIEIVPVWSGLSEEEGLKAAEDSLTLWRKLFRED